MGTRGSFLGGKAAGA